MESEDEYVESCDFGTITSFVAVMHALLTGFVSISSALILGDRFIIFQANKFYCSLANVFSLFAFSKLTNSVVLHWVIYYHCLSYVHPLFSGLSHFLKGAFLF